MTELLTAAQMRSLERAAIGSGEVSGLELMERAGRAVVEAIFQQWPALVERGASPSRSPGYLRTKDGGRRAVVLCGPGNNGGDGFVVARLLKELGWEVAVFLYGDPGKLPPDAKANFERWREIGEVAPLGDDIGDGWRCDVLIDALFGTGVTRSLQPLGRLFREMADMRDGFDGEVGHRRGRPAIVAVDMPSGVCSDSGREFPHEDDHFGFSAFAHLTVAFHRAKLGHFLGVGPDRCGKTVVRDIGLTEAGDWRQRHGREIARLVGPLPPSGLRKGSDDHKYSHGHALLLSGGAGHTGAARLAARGALRIGAGLVTLGVPPSAQMEVAEQITAIMLRRVADGDALRAVLGDKRINALCLGPGLGGARARALVPVALAAGHGVVLDADALTTFGDDPEALFAMLHEGCVLTPHGGEFARLFPDIAEKLAATPARGPAYSKVDATREAAARAGCVVLFKGPDTVIAAPDGRCGINSARYERAAPWLATAGAGDVLAGFVTGLMARGMAPMRAAESAVWLHVECALGFGPGLIAEDIPEEIPRVFGKLGV